MSGGHFQYKQWEINNIADEIEQLILNNEVLLQEFFQLEEPRFTPETIEEFKKGLSALRQAYVYAQRIDWLVCGDDGEDSFHRRLQHDLKKLEN